MARTESSPRLTSRALNRALLTRQGLLEPLAVPLVEAVESLGALQAQRWPAVAVALWSRLRQLQLEELYAEFSSRRLVVGNLLRGTLHAVSARRQPAFAAVVGGGGLTDWRRTEGQGPLDLTALRADLAAFASSVPRTAEQIVERIETWVTAQGAAIEDAELARQRAYRWRPFLSSTDLIRVPADGRWTGGRPPGAFLAAPSLQAEPLEAGDALDSVIRWHLAAFGPAAAEDVAAWTGLRTPPLRTALERMGADLVAFEDESGRKLFDLPSAPRPDPDLVAPVRLLPWFDSAILAYAPRHRRRILPDAYRDLVYVRANLQWLPTVLIDGMVAGTWSADLGGRRASLRLQLFERLDRRTEASVTEEAERLIRFMKPHAAGHAVHLGAG